MSEKDTPPPEAPAAPEPAKSQDFIRRPEPPLPERIGPYRILRKLGAGGMGAVFEGLNEAIERRVAIKMLHSRYSHDSDIATRFINEARAVNRIEHPGVVQVSDHGQLPDGSAYIVMELLQGETLSTRIHRYGTLPVGECIDLAAQVAESLAAAHEKGIIHRDLKPDNIMIVPDRQMPTGERTKILDFGIAKLATGEERSQIKTQTNAMLGTPFYMSPENTTTISLRRRFRVGQGLGTVLGLIGTG
jgi:serine/threonine protein kinase